MFARRRVKRRNVQLGRRVLEVKSGLEASLALQIHATGAPVRYEEQKLKYVVPERTATYNPDFELPNGIIVEGKGEFTSKDRQKHLFVRDAHPHLDIRFVFNNPNARLYKGSPSTYATWCEEHGFKYAAKLIPPSWFKERQCR